MVHCSKLHYMAITTSQRIVPRGVISTTSQRIVPRGVISTTSHKTRVNHQLKEAKWRPTNWSATPCMTAKERRQWIQASASHSVTWAWMRYQRHTRSRRSWAAVQFFSSILEHLWYHMRGKCLRLPHTSQSPSPEIIWVMQVTFFTKLQNALLTSLNSITLQNVMQEICQKIWFFFCVLSTHLNAVLHRFEMD